jgi:hypothetical protein
MGNEVPLFTNMQSCSLERKLLVIRLQALHLLNPHYGSIDIGSVLFADTFFQLDASQGMDTAMNITKNVPTIQLWQTTHKHYENLPKPILTEKNLHCEQIGERVNYYQDM